MNSFPVGNASQSAWTSSSPYDDRRAPQPARGRGRAFLRSPTATRGDPETRAAPRLLIRARQIGSPRSAASPSAYSTAESLFRNSACVGERVATRQETPRSAGCLHVLGQAAVAIEQALHRSAASVMLLTRT